MLTVVIWWKTGELVALILFVFVQTRHFYVLNQSENISWVQLNTCKRHNWLSGRLLWKRKWNSFWKNTLYKHLWSMQWQRSSI